MRGVSCGTGSPRVFRAGRIVVGRLDFMLYSRRRNN